MALTVTDATAYISANCIDIEDWTEADDAKKLRIINVADRTLSTKYAQYTVPEAAVFEFANVLATVFNDTNRMAQAGVLSFQVSGTASFNFKDAEVRGPGGDLARYIPQAALDAIGTANGGVKLARRNVGWSVI
ncbi:hypothetical protein [Paenibacillus naphthalenovorans]|uniref:hypothetical protein n=1 Tax=Paenibacillus naphthalenovorans TaxID=162209 RepID=UPI003D2A4BA2